MLDQRTSNDRTARPSFIQRQWYVLGPFAVWVPKGESRKSAVPQGYDEIQSEPEMYAPMHQWQPYQGGAEEKRENKSESSPAMSRPTLEKKLPILRIKQLHKGWCYAATSKIMDAALANKSLEQWQYVRAFRATRDKDAATLPEQEIHSRYAEDYGVEQFTYCKKGETVIELTEEVIVESLYQRNSPLLLGLGSHSYVMYGYRPRDQSVLLWDPLAGETEFTIDAVNLMFEGGQAEIHHSFTPI